MSDCYRMVSKKKLLPTIAISDLSICLDGKMVLCFEVLVNPKIELILDKIHSSKKPQLQHIITNRKKTIITYEIQR